MAILIVVAIICVGLGILIGFFYWAKKASTNSYAKVWSIVGLSTVLFYVIAFYIAGRLAIGQKRRELESHRKKEDEVVMNKKKANEREMMFRF